MSETVEGCPDLNNAILDTLTESINRDDIRFGVEKFIQETDFDEHGKKKNTSLAYDPKVIEFKQFCDQVFGGLPLSGPQGRYNVNQTKVYGFFLYVAFRERKRRGRKKSVEDNTVVNNSVVFDVKEWNRIAVTMKRATTGQILNSNPEELETLQLATKGRFCSAFYKLIEPKKGVGFSTMVTTKAAIKKLWLSQVEGTPLLSMEDEIFGLTFTKMMNIVKERKIRQARLNYVEKVDKDSAPMESVSHINVLEQSLFDHGVSTSGKFKASQKSVHSSLRNRFIFLCTTCGVLRGESMFKAELSDLYNIAVTQKKDPHPFMILILQISAGKMNQNGYKIFGRMGRNFDVNVCPIGALGFYLMYRFHHSRELNNPEKPIDWTTNESWFNIKLLTQFGTTDNGECISDSTYSNAVKKNMRRKQNCV